MTSDQPPSATALIAAAIHRCEYGCEAPQDYNCITEGIEESLMCDPCLIASLLSRLDIVEQELDALRLQIPGQPQSHLRVLLELDGPEPTLKRIAAFLRQDAVMQRTPPMHRWDVPETMANTYENAATLLEKEQAQLEAAESRCQALEQEKTTLIALIASDLRVDGWDPPLVNWLKTPEDAVRAMTLNMAKSRDELKHQNRALTARVEALEAQLKEAATVKGALKVVYRALRDDEQGEYWSARKWLDAHDVFHGDINGRRVLVEVCKSALTPPTPKEPA